MFRWKRATNHCSRCSSLDSISRRCDRPSNYFAVMLSICLWVRNPNRFLTSRDVWKRQWNNLDFTIGKEVMRLTPLCFEVQLFSGGRTSVFIFMCFSAASCYDITVLSTVWRVMRVMRLEMNQGRKQIPHSPSYSLSLRWHENMSQYDSFGFLTEPIVWLSLFNSITWSSFSVHLHDVMDFTFLLPSISLNILQKH